MRKIILFMMVSLDGFFEGPNDDLSWHNVDEEFNVFAAEQMQEAGGLLFGKKTCELMAGFWPTEEPIDPSDAIVRERMNNLPKVVFSKTLEKVGEGLNWKNATLIKDNVEEEIKRLKEQSGKDLFVLASNTLCVSLIKMGLLDEVRVMVNPVVISKGTRLFEGLNEKVNLKLLKSRIFVSGNVLLYYQIVK